MQTYQAAGEKTICNEKYGDIGNVVILPEVAWRKDQKEPEKRKVMALEEIEREFQALPCGSILKPGGIREFADWSGRPESELLNQFSEQGIDIIILIRIEELTPRLSLTFSVPFLWGGTNEADFHIRVLSVRSGTVLTDMRVKRSTGGPFNIRPAEWSRVELSKALNEIIGNGK
jgi:hypothetical protein